MKMYILKDRVPVQVRDTIEWAKWFEKADRIVKQDDAAKDVRVSTVFLGIDHNFYGGTPLVFETMIFGGPHDQYQRRCSTWNQAEEMHAEALKLAKEGT